MPLALRDLENKPRQPYQCSKPAMAVWKIKRKVQKIYILELVQIKAVLSQAKRKNLIKHNFSVSRWRATPPLSLSPNTNRLSAYRCIPRNRACVFQACINYLPRWAILLFMPLCCVMAVATPGWFTSTSVVPRGVVGAPPYFNQVTAHHFVSSS